MNDAKEETSHRHRHGQERQTSRHHHRHRHHHHEKSDGDPFLPAGGSLFDFGGEQAEGGYGIGVPSTAHTPPLVHDGGRRQQETRIHSSSASARASSASSSSSSSSSAIVKTGGDDDGDVVHRSPFRRDGRGHLIVVDEQEEMRQRTRTGRGSKGDRTRTRAGRTAGKNEGDTRDELEQERDGHHHRRRRHERRIKRDQKVAPSSAATTTAAAVGIAGDEDNGTEPSSLTRGSGGSADADGEGGDGLYDYDPDDPEALAEKAHLLKVTAEKMDPTTCGGLQHAPCEFQRAPIPYWVQRLSDLLLFHNSTRSSSGPGVLPVDSALRQLRADLKEARQLLREVKQGKDWGFLRTRPANMYEVYGPVTEAEEEQEEEQSPKDGEEEMVPILGGDATRGGAAEDAAVEVQVMEDTTEEASTEPTGEAATAADSAGKKKKKAAKHSGRASSVGPLLSPEDEAADEALPLLQRAIPLWRRRGAAVQTLSELIEHLDNRLYLLEKKLSDPQDGAWYEAVGAPDSTGVDGTQRSTLPAALEQSYAAFMTSAVLSDLFIPVAHLNGLSERAARVSAAFLAQTPKVHDQFIIEEDFRPMYDYLLTRPANMLESPYTEVRAAAGRSASSTARSEKDLRRSFTVHVDYIRLHPPQPTGLLMLGNAGGGAPAALGLGRRGSLDDTFSRLLTDTQYYASLLTGDSLEDTLMMAESLSATALGAAAATAGPATAAGRRASAASTVGMLPFGPTSAAVLSMLSVAAAQEHALVAFTPETYLIAMLLQHYERYRLLRLNLLPYLKTRGFYEEQLAHLAQQRTRRPEVEQLQKQLEMLRDKSTALERTAMTAMIALWRGVLHLRRSSTSSSGAGDVNGGGRSVYDNGAGIPFIVSSHRDARAAALAAAAAAAESGHSRFDGNNDTVTAAGASGVATSAMLQMTDGEAAGPPELAMTGRRNVQEMDVFLTDSSSSPLSSRSLPLDPPVPDATAASSAPDNNSLFASTAGRHQHTRADGADIPSAAGSIILRGPIRDTSATTTGPTAATSASATTHDGDGGFVAVRSAQRAPRFRFFLRRVGRMAETPYVEGDDVLLYEPVVEGTDALLPAPDSLPSSSSQGAMGGADTGAQHEERRRGLSKERLDTMQFFQIAVFARASAAVPPQYVGCTMPRPLTTANVVFFNESFEIRVLREPIEIILHVIVVSDGPAKGSVVATVRLQPTLTRGYLLLPLQAPVSFMFKKRLMARYTGTGLTGVLSASTTWTTAHGLSIPQIERLFMSGAADPLNPEYAPMLRLLRKYYVELERNRAKQTAEGGDSGGGERQRGGRARGRPRARARSSGAACDAEEDGNAYNSRSSRRGSRHRRRGSTSNASAVAISASVIGGSSSKYEDTPGGHSLRDAAAAQHRKPFTPEMLLSLPLVVGTSHGASHGSSGSGSDAVVVDHIRTSDRRHPSAASAVWTNRLLLMRHRWLIAAGQSKALDKVEATLLRYPIPLYADEQYDLLKWVKRQLAREAAERRKAYDMEAGASRANGNDLRSLNDPGDLFDEKAYAEEPSSVSGLALSPLPKEVKLKLWQDRQRHMKLTRKPVHHITDEERLGQIVTIPTFSLKLVFDLKPRSQFNPRRVARPKNEDIDRELLNRRRDSRIVVHVMKANNLPERADGTPLEPFVQVGFVYENTYSRCEVGTSPTWFQSLEMPFQPLDFAEETLSMIDDDIIISVYDKVEIPMPPATVTTGAVAHETHYRTERRLLGTLRLPFYSLHQADEARMEGVFPLTTPRWLLGYDASSATRTEAAQNPFGEDPAQAAASNRSVSIGPTIHFYISLWPPLQREKPKSMSANDLAAMVRQLNVNAELRHLHEVALKWAKTATGKIKAITKLNAQATARKVEPFVNCSTGDLVLACRYLLPHGGPPPPQTVTNIFEAIRYVSLLPFVVDIMAWGDKDVWSTNVELLAMRGGDYEELALLLAHFLRHLDPANATYVVVGEGEIYAQTIMVLHAFEDGGTQWRLIDPRTGWIAPVERPFGTILRDVHYVLSHDQMWANIQLSGLPHRMSWRLDDPVHWLPCFAPARDKRVARCMPALTSIQREVLTFQPVDTVKAKEIEVDLRAALRKSLLAWRNHRPPAFHRGVEAILRDLLVIAEDEKCACGSVRHPAVTAMAKERLAEYFGLPIDGVSFENTKEDKKRQARQRERERKDAAVAAADGDSAKGAKPRRRAGSGRIRQQRPCVRLVGAPVTSSYSSSDKKYYKILQQVFECAAHEVGTDDVSFAAGVHVKSYTGDVFAMWVFLVAICRGVEDVTESDED